MAREASRTGTVRARLAAYCITPAAARGRPMYMKHGKTSGAVMRVTVSDAGSWALLMPVFMLAEKQFSVGRERVSPVCHGQCTNQFSGRHVNLGRLRTCIAAKESEFCHGFETDGISVDRQYLLMVR